jgi:hypothetical protein
MAASTATPATVTTMPARLSRRPSRVTRFLQATGGGARAITAQAPAAARSALEHLLRTAFVHGLNAVALMGAILALAGA